jgi:lambda family phage tail tape measure protein
VAAQQLKDNDIKAAAEAADKERQRTFVDGWKNAMRDYEEAANNAAGNAKSLFEAASQGIEDAFVQMVTTGKMSFTDLVNTILAEMARIAAKKVSAGLMDGVSSLIPSMAGWFSGGTASAGAGAAGTASAFSAGATYVAKGGVYNSPSLSAYSGGVYDRPQLFGFAHGAGIFGEAGPEAIMPLTRGSDGKLGVQATGQSGGVSIVINNMASDKVEATAKPRMNDGKFEIEVLIQQALAKDMGRNGPITQGLASTFGLARSV